MGKPKIILLVVENRDYVLLDFTKWLSGVAFRHEVDGIIYWNYKKKPVWYMRRELIKSALKGKECTHVLFVDTDTIPPNNFIERLMTLDCDIISGIYYNTQGRPNSIKNGKFYQGRGLEEVDVAAMGACLIKREVLEKVEYPEPDNVTIDADVEFFREAKKAGFKVMQDFGARCGHLLLSDF